MVSYGLLFVLIAGFVAVGYQNFYLQGELETCMKKKDLLNQLMDQALVINNITAHSLRFCNPELNTKIDYCQMFKGPERKILLELRDEYERLSYADFLTWVAVKYPTLSEKHKQGTWISSLKLLKDCPH